MSVNDWRNEMKNCLFVLSIIGFLVTGCGVNNHENVNQFETTEAIVEIKEISKPQQNTEELEYLNERKKSKNQGHNTEKDNAVEKSSSAQEEHLPNNKADYVTENENSKIKKDDRSKFKEFISENQKEYKYYAYADMNSDGQSELLLSEFGTKKGGVTVSDRIDVYALKGKEVEFVGSIHSTFDYISIGLEDGLIRYPWSGSGWSQWMFCSINDKNQLVLTYLSINDEKYFFEEENEIHQISNDRFEKLYEEWSKNEYISFMKIESTSESIEDDNDIPDGIYECNHQGIDGQTFSDFGIVNLYRAYIDNETLTIWGALYSEKSDSVLEYDERSINLSDNCIIQGHDEVGAFPYTDEEFNNMFYEYEHISGLGVEILIEGGEVVQIDIWS